MDVTTARKVDPDDRSTWPPPQDMPVLAWYPRTGIWDGFGVPGHASTRNMLEQGVVTHWMPQPPAPVR